jgi:hypothetical protein
VCLDCLTSDCIPEFFPRIQIRVRWCFPADLLNLDLDVYEKIGADLLEGAHLVGTERDIETIDVNRIQSLVNDDVEIVGTMHKDRVVAPNTQNKRALGSVDLGESPQPDVIEILGNFCSCG